VIAFMIGFENLILKYSQIRLNLTIKTIRKVGIKNQTTFLTSQSIRLIMN